MADILNIDNKIKSAMDGFSIPSTAANTARFAKRLKWYNFMQFKFSTFNIYNVILTASIITGSTVLLVNKNAEIENEKMPVQESVVISPDTLQLNVDTVKYEKNAVEVKKVISTDKKEEIKNPTLVKDTLVVTVTDTLIDKINIVIKDTVKIKKKIIIER